MIMKRWPVTVQVLFLIVVIIAIVTAVILMAYDNIFRIVSGHSEDYLSRLTQQQEGVLEDRMGVLSSIAHSIAFTDVTQEFLSSSDMALRIRVRGQAQSLCQSMARLHAEVLSISIYTPASQMPGQERSFVDSMEREGKKVACSTLTEAFLNARMQKVVLLVQKVYYMGMLPDNKTRQGTHIGWVVMYIDPAKLPFAAYNGNECFLLADKNGAVLAGSGLDKGDAVPAICAGIEPGGIRRFSLDAKRYAAVACDVSGLDGMLYMQQDEEAMLSGVADTRRKLFWLLAIALLITLVPMLLVLLGNLTLPMGRFARFLRSIHSGNPKSIARRADMEGFAELNIVVREFNNMMDEIHSLTAKEIQSRTQLIESRLAEKQSQFELLQSQINPHFLYNTLESIKGVALINHDGQAFEIAEALGVILRYSIKGPDFVPLSRELEVARLYMSIQGYRFSDRFHMRYDVDSAATEAAVPRMLLQPLLENAISHGIEPLMRKGNVLLRADMTDAVLHVEVTDDGMGMDDGTLAHLRSQFQRVERRPEATPRAKIGLINVHERLVLLYGAASGINIESELGKGTRVWFTIPGTVGEL